MEQGTVAQNIAISLPDMKENGNRRQEVAVKVTIIGELFKLHLNCVRVCCDSCFIQY